MSSTRGHKLKSDLANIPLVRHIPSKAIVSDRMQPVYHEMLHSLGSQDLDIIQQSLAILIARSFCTMLEIILIRDKVFNEADVAIYKAPLDDLAQVTKAYSELVRTFYSVAGKTRTRDEPESETMDPAELLQRELMKLRHDNNGDRT